MTTRTLARPGLAPTAPARFAPGLKGAVRGFLRRLVELDTLYRERLEITALDDRMLRDIGVTRGQVERAMRRPEAHLRLIRRRSALHQL